MFFFLKIKLYEFIRNLYKIVAFSHEIGLTKTFLFVLTWQFLVDPDVSISNKRKSRKNLGVNGLLLCLYVRLWDSSCKETDAGKYELYFALICPVFFFFSSIETCIGHWFVCVCLKHACVVLCYGSSQRIHHPSL